ncbi:MAG: hypothetical protein ACP5D9_02815 [Mariniphaga sp.]
MGLFLLLAASSSIVSAQQVVIDKPVRAGELTLFPTMEDENIYYYLPDKLKLATDANGKPQFSFLRYVENIRSGPEEEAREGTGGGIVHAVVELWVTPEQIAEARNALRRTNADGIIQGPVIYSGGTMAIISSFANTEGDLTKRVVGIGKAPLVDGHKAAVSMELTKKGAKILWESFQTPTPDMSFSLEMELEGYRAPKKAVIEADFEKIYNHHGFQFGASGNYDNIVFGGEIDLAFDELRNDGAIKITNMGADDDMEKLIETAYNKLTTMMFEPIGGTGNPIIKNIAGTLSGQKSPMDRATELYKQNKKNSEGKKTSFLWKYPVLKDHLLLAFDGKNDLFASSFLGNSPGESGQQPDWLPKDIKETYKDFVQLHTSVPDNLKELYLARLNNNEYANASNLTDVEKRLSSKQKPVAYYQQYMLSEAERNHFKSIIDGSEAPSSEYKALIESKIKVLIGTQAFLNQAQKDYILQTFEPDVSESWGADQALTYAAWVVQNGNQYNPQNEKSRKILSKLIELGKQGETDAPSQTGEVKGEINDNEMVELLKNIDNNSGDKLETTASKTQTEKKGATTDKKSKASDEKKTESSAKAKQSDESKKKADAAKDKKEAKKKEEKTDFKLALMASYQMKKVKQTGTFKISLNKYTADKIVLRFDENIGKIDFDECFHQVNLDDPLFKQREIVAMIDGFNFDDFGKYINFVTVKMKKTHQNGDITWDEVRIDRENFIKSANNFKLLYGWKGDDDRSEWLDYKYQAQWSFFGGNEVTTNWFEANANGINLAPPYLRKTIELEADPELLEQNNVRSVNVKFYYKLGESEQVKQITMLPSREEYSSKINLLLPKETNEYDYEIIWRLKGNKTETSGRQTTSESILFVDEMGV